MKKSLMFLSCALFLLMFSNRASAFIIFDDLSGGYINGGWSIGSSADFEVGQAFTPSAQYALSSISLAANLGGGNNDPLTVSLMSDNSGKPGSAIETFTFSNLPNLPSVLTANSVLNPTLDAGTQYWLVAKTDTTTQDIWDWNSAFSSDLHAGSTDHGTTWSTSDSISGAFEIQGTSVSTSAVPEPATLALFAFGLLAISGFARFGQFGLPPKS